MAKAGVDHVPQAAVATFVGTEFDSLTGRGGDDGTPLRKTPWGEIAWQLGKQDSFSVIARHDEEFTAPGGDVIRKMLPKDRPTLILMDELLNYVSRSRKSGLSGQFYNFLHELSETARGEDNVVLAVSIPASELEMTAEDEADYTRFKKMLDRLGKAVIMAAETETSEIIRRRLFDWGGLPPEARRVAAEYAEWIRSNRTQVPQWFPVDNAEEAIAASYPFHPMAISVFERKWQALPRFQQTRGVLRMLALWVARAYQDGYKGAHKDPLIGLGTAPLEDPLFRTAVLEQLGEQRLEAAITTDICGAKGAFATRLDEEAVDTIKEARLHRKIATAIFFESNGGQAKEGEATVPEIRLDVAEPDLDIGNVETSLEALGQTCYFLRVERNRYRFGLSPNLNKLLADRKASVDGSRIEETIRGEILKAFEEEPGAKVVPFAEESSQVPDRPLIAIVVLPPHCSMAESDTLSKVDAMIREHGSSGRTFKSALLFAIPDDDAPLREEARKLLAWEDIRDEEKEKLDEGQRTKLAENLKKAERDLREAVWRTYKNVALLGKDNKVRKVDLGLVHSSQAPSMVKLIVDRLRQDGDIETGISPNFLVRNWPPAFTEWSTKSVRDAFFASPQFPRLLDAEAVKETIARGVSGGMLAYVGKTDGTYKPFIFEQSIGAEDVEISEDMFIITQAEAKKHVEPPKLTRLEILPERPTIKPGQHATFQVKGFDQHERPMEVSEATWSAKGGEIDDKGGFKAGSEEGEYLVEADVGDVHAQTTVVISEKEAPPEAGPSEKRAAAGIGGLRWQGEVPPQKWMNFYTKVLAKHATTGKLKLTVSFQIEPDDGLRPESLEETKALLRELGLDDDVEPL
ncbi:MAG: ATP-binding protein [Phycisphaerae bacterium]